MRRATFLIVLVTLLALPASADARSVRNPVLDVVSTPARIAEGIVGHRRAHRPRHRYRYALARHHRRVVARSGEPQIAQEQRRDQPAPRLVTVDPRALAAQRQESGKEAGKEPGAPPGGSPRWSGPLYWPTAFDDLFDYALRPEDTGERFWAHGARDLVEAMFPRAASAGIQACGSGRRDVAASWRSEIAGKTSLNDAQTRSLDDLGAALAAANDDVKATCPPADARRRSTERLDAMTDRIWALRQAAVQVRTPLETFLSGLSDEQKARWSDKASGSSISAAQNAARACADPSAAASWPSDQIEARVRPASEQRAPLQTLQMTTQGMAQQLAASCPTDLPTAPLARLDAAEKRLNAMLYAARVVAPALSGLYAALSDEQKSAFDSLAPRPATSAQAPDAPMRGER